MIAPVATHFHVADEDRAVVDVEDAVEDVVVVVADAILVVETGTQALNGGYISEEWT